MADPPAQLAGAASSFKGVGTILFNMAVNPVNGKIYVSNTEAFNQERFEGPGTFADHSLPGHLHESRITVLGPEGVFPRHLNKHIDYNTCCAPASNLENEKSLALPLGMAITGDGATLYVAALGSIKVGGYSTAALENDTFVPDAAHHIPVSGGGPTGVVLGKGDDRLYVLTRFDNAISVIDTTYQAEIAHVPMYNPEPPSVVKGRRFLYDASFSSSHGDSACASCHVFGDFDSLPWDLGNPDGAMQTNPNPIKISLFQFPEDPSFHPMKGPLTTQSLRGMANHGPMHWRGDRTGGGPVANTQPNDGAFDEVAAFKKFNVGFTDLLGRSDFIPEADMQDFTDFILQVTYPPNPVRALDNSLTADEQAGRDFFFNRVTDLGAITCQGCHTLDPAANGEYGIAAPGFFGTDGTSAREGFPQMMNIPHFRNLYQKVGMFGMAPAFNILPNPEIDGFMGNQVRGSGFSRAGELERRQVESFLLAFDSNLAPIVGQQVTLSKTNAAVTNPRIDLLLARAAAGECDVVVKGRHGNKERGFLYIGTGMYLPNVSGNPHISDAALRAQVTKSKSELTFTCAPPGSGVRIGLDRDRDGVLDGDE